MTLTALFLTTTVAASSSTAFAQAKVKVKEKANTSSTAKETPPPAAGAAAVRTLTLDEALSMARKRNRNLVVEQARLAQAQTNVEQAWSSLFPTVVAQGKYTRNNKAAPPFPSFGDPTKSLIIQPLNQLDAVASFTAPLISPAAWSALSAVKSNVRAATENFEVAEADVLFGVAQAFFAAAIADEVLAARQSGIEVARATLVGAQARLAAGTVTKVDAHRAEVAVLQAQQAEREARYGREMAYRALATLIQAEGPFKAQPPASMPSPPSGADEFNTALKLRPEFRALDLSVQSAEAQADAQGWRWSPTLSAFGNARRFNYDNFLGQRHAWAVGLQLDWVLFDGGTRDALRHAAGAAADEARARADVLRDTIRNDLTNNRSLLDTKRHAVETAERSVQLSTETLELVRAQYQAGNITQVDLLSAQDAKILSELALAQAHFDLAIADLTLRRAAGTFPGK